LPEKEQKQPLNKETEKLIQQAVNVVVEESTKKLQGFMTGINSVAQSALKLGLPEDQ
jgi:hypothetical protein